MGSRSVPRSLAIAVISCLACAITPTAAIASAATGADAAPPRCTVDQLRITEGSIPVGLDHGGFSVRFTNRGPACRLGGYPGAAALDAHGRVTLNARRTRYGYLGGLHTRASIPTISLTHGRTASAVIEWEDGPIRGLICRPADRFEVTPPGDLRSVGIPGLRNDREVICDLQIHPVLPGRSGSDPAR